MKRCLLGCGCVVHDVEAHITQMHPDRKADLPVVPEWRPNMSGTDRDFYYDAADDLERFIKDNFEAVTFS